MNCNEAIVHVLNCKRCTKLLAGISAQKAGSTITKAKSEAARINGLKGGRPKGS